MTYQSDYAATEPSRSEIDAQVGVTVLEFGAPWCGHCAAAQPALRELLATRPEVRHLKIEDGSGRPLGHSFGIKLWPTLVVVRDGQETARVVRPRTLDDLDEVRVAMDAPTGLPPLKKGG
ncbi:MAG TPA: thioredoxin family protein [Pseudoxanthomonas sp.]